MSRFAAEARTLNLDPYRDDATFLASVRAALGRTAAGEIAELDRIPGSEPPCAAFVVDGKPPAGAGTARLYGKFCHDAKVAHLGYAAFFSYQGARPAAEVDALAQGFLSGVKPAR